MAVMDSHPPVNLIRSIFLCNIFNFFLAAGKSCLIPFLTLYFKKLGLSPSQAGLIIGAKTFVGLVFAPLWSRCAVRCGKRRLVLMFSLLVMASTYLSLTAVPSFDNNAFASRCEVTPPFNESQWETKPSTQTIVQPEQNVNTSVDNNLNDINSVTINYFNENKGKNTNNTQAIELKPTAASKPTDSPEDESQANEMANKPATRIPDLTSSATTQAKRSTELSIAESDDLKNLLQQILVNIGMTPNRVSQFDEDKMIQLINGMMENEEGKSLLYKAIAKLSLEQQSLLGKLDGIRKRRSLSKDEATSDTTDTSGTGVIQKILKQVNDFRDQLIETEYHMFVVVMVILMVGESFCCPIEKVADDGWFEFLESIDDMEKYGMQRIWTTFAYILFPFIITLAVDNTNCLFGLSVHPFMLHFYLFGALIGITFIIAFFFPMTTMDKYRYASKVGKGMKMICCNLRSMLLMITLLLMGVVYASYYNFLFWLLEDLGSQELTMGMCLALAALAEIPMLLFNEKLIKKIGNGGVMGLSLLFLSARCLYYSFLVTPWAVLPAELSHAFTHTAMWWAVLSSPSFNTSPALTRSIRSLLSSVYFGIGFGMGSIVSGFVYELYSSAILFQAGAVLAIGWFPVLCIGVRCCREKDRSQVKYTRLLTSDDASDTDSMEDDWLEEALKDR
ncbi:major facilitator superfamily domain-containing protein 6-like protein A [Mya arenaria]|uniref:major facilitator superfamily domain-containing protein 6-like protein A n=1 Tax=Mya arenaria TaxID=6604 RepID=UPI0022E9207F|nr:major facilitator superfamily domain-containing protein 6-like protein A [Mya arenaria]XP_052761327.1 major facilitator superfamily domain-containing protein 6-like protein A [Mya arenaria]XP_052761328.1 major facilitator superfamily domain-containing protein 6-like protein A [Mya arenaria]